jgi:hypothetical protein
MRAAIIGALMAMGMLAGCGGMNGDVDVTCADGSTCSGSAATCAAQCRGTDAAQLPDDSKLMSTEQNIIVTCCGAQCSGAASECAEFCKSFCD